jgi:hypothetical protein
VALTDRFRYPASVTFAVAGAALLCLWGVGVSPGYERLYWSDVGDPYFVVGQGTRLAGLRALVPENAVVGYLSDPGDPRILMSAYALAPRLIRLGAEPDWVVGDFARRTDFAALGRQYGLRVVRDFGNGVVLYRREGR